MKPEHSWVARCAASLDFTALASTKHLHSQWPCKLAMPHFHSSCKLPISKERKGKTTKICVSTLRYARCHSHSAPACCCVAMPRWCTFFTRLTGWMISPPARLVFAMPRARIALLQPPLLSPPYRAARIVLLHTPRVLALPYRAARSTSRGCTRSM